ncbi:hypothetical protein [Mesobacillus sp. S13]|uniref:hypothetical protein n=1 Tax=Mesobacillus sp. S13 TaxID=2880221 RepID=UPI001CF49BDB|nr:hypothetical protein [Mesobacillus sp. S13]
MDNKKERKHSDHFINVVTKGKTFDFNDFKTREELDRFNEELQEFLKENEKNKKE